jgi:hypothetical protein
MTKCLHAAIEKRASRCREIASKAFLAKKNSGLRTVGARRTLKRFSGINPIINCDPLSIIANIHKN